MSLGPIITTIGQIVAPLFIAVTGVVVLYLITGRSARRKARLNKSNQSVSQPTQPAGQQRRSEKATVRVCCRDGQSILIELDDDIDINNDDDIDNALRAALAIAEKRFNTPDN